MTTAHSASKRRASPVAAAHRAHRYDFDTVHPAAKQIGVNVDIFMFGSDAYGLLLFCGDLKAMRAGAAKVLDAHRRSLARVQVPCVRDE